MPLRDYKNKIEGLDSTDFAQITMFVNKYKSMGISERESSMMGLRDYALVLNERLNTIKRAFSVNEDIINIDESTHDPIKETIVNESLDDNMLSKTLKFHVDHMSISDLKQTLEERDMTIVKLNNK